MTVRWQGQQAWVQGSKDGSIPLSPNTSYSNLQQGNATIHRFKRESDADAFEFDLVALSIVIGSPVVFTPVDDDLPSGTADQHVLLHGG